MVINIVVPFTKKMAITTHFEERNFKATEVAAAFLPMSEARGFSLVFW